MFKKIVSHFTLLSLINTQVSSVLHACEIISQPSFTSEHDKSELQPNHIKVKNNVIELDLKALLSKPLSNMAAEIKYQEQTVGSLLYNHQAKQLALDCSAGYNLTLKNIPTLSDFYVQVDGDLTVVETVFFSNVLHIDAKGKACLQAGFCFHDKGKEKDPSTEKQNSLAVFSGGNFEIGGSSYALRVILGELESFKTNKGSSLEAVELGYLKRDEECQKYIKNMSLFGSLKVRQAEVIVERFNANAPLNASYLKLVADYATIRQPLFSDYCDIKLNELNNLSTIQSKDFYIDALTLINRKTINAENVLCATGGWYNTDKASVKVGSYFQGDFSTYQDDGQTTVAGLANIQAVTGRLTGKFNASNALIRLRDEIHIPKGAQFKVVRHLTLYSGQNLDFEGEAVLQHQPDREVNVQAPVSNLISNLAPGIYLSAVGNLYRSGSIISKNTSILYTAGGNLINQGFCRVGFFEENNILFNGMEVWLKGRIESFQNIYLQARNAYLHGYREAAGRFYAQVEGDLFSHENDNHNVSNNIFKAKCLHHAGDVNSKDSNDIIADRVRLYPGSRLKAGNNTLFEIGETFISKGATLEAKNHSFKGGHLIGIAGGKIHSENQFHIDTYGPFLNFMNIIQAKKAEVYVDKGCFNILAWLSTGYTKINSLINFNILSFTSAAKVYSVNALADINLSNILACQNAERNAAIIFKSPDSIEIRGIGFFLEFLSSWDPNKSWREQPYIKSTIYDQEKSWIEQPLIQHYLYNSQENWRNQPLWGTSLGLAQLLLKISYESASLMLHILMNARNTGSFMRELLAVLSKPSVGEEACRISHIAEKVGTAIGSLNKLAKASQALCESSNTLLEKQSLSVASIKCNFENLSKVAETFIQQAPRILVSGPELKKRIQEEIYSQYAGQCIETCILFYSKAKDYGGHSHRYSVWDNDTSKKNVQSHTLHTVFGKDAGTTQAERVTVYAALKYEIGSKRQVKIYDVCSWGDLKLQKGCVLNLGDLTKLISYGELELPSSVEITGKSLFVKAGSVQNFNIEDFMAQRGKYAGFNISDNLDFTTGKAVTFEGNVQSKSKNFSLNAPSINVKEQGSLTAPGALQLTSIEGDICLGAGVELTGGSYLGLTSANNITAKCGQEELARKDNRKKYGVGEVKWNGVNLNGGEGVSYIYIDSASGETSDRRVAINLKANGKVDLTAPHYKANADIIVNGNQDVNHNGVAVEYSAIHHRGKGKTWEETKTAFFGPIVNTPGKFNVMSLNGKINAEAGKINAGEGGYLVAQENINLKSLFGILQGKHNSRKTEETTHIHNNGDGKTQIVSLKGDANLAGMNYLGPTASLLIRGEDIHLNRSLLDYKYCSINRKVSWDYSILPDYTSLEILQSIKDISSHINSGNYGQACQSLNTSINVNITENKTRGRGQYLGAGGIITKNLSIITPGKFCLNNGYEIHVSNNAYIKAAVLEQVGACLNKTTKTWSRGIFAELSLNSATVGVNFGKTKATETSWVPATIYVGGTLIAYIDQVNQTAGIISANQGQGHIGMFNSTTTQDTSSIKGWNISTTLSYNYAQGVIVPGLNLNYFQNGTRQAHHTSGIFLNEGNDCDINKANCRGASVQGPRVDKIKHHSLPREYQNLGGSAGISIIFPGSQAPLVKGLSLGVDNGSDHLQTHINLGNSHSAAEDSQLWNSLGNVSFGRGKWRLTVPLILSINLPAWCEFAEDMQELAEKFGDSVRSHLWPQSQVPMPVLPYESQDYQYLSSYFNRPPTIDMGPESPETSNPISNSYDVVKSDVEAITPSLWTFWNMAVILGSSQVARRERARITDESPSQQMLSEAVKVLNATTFTGEIQRWIQHRIVKVLDQPWKFHPSWLKDKDPVLFPYRSEAINIYLQSPAHQKIYLKALNDLRRNLSVYAQRAAGALESTPTILCFDGPFTLGKAIAFHKENVLGIAMEQKICQLPPLIAHESMHLLPYGEANAINKAYFKDIESLPINSLKEIKGMVEEPWRSFTDYIERIFKNRHIELSSNAKGEIFALCRPQIAQNGEVTNLEDILKIFKKDAKLKGIPLEDYFKIPGFEHRLRDIICSDLKAATQRMAGEIPTFATETDMVRKGSISKYFPNTHKYLTKHLKLPSKFTAALKAGWHSVKPALPYIVTAVDFALHITAQAPKGGSGSEVLAKGIVSTMCDAAVYMPFYGVISTLAGGPIAFGVGGLAALYATVPAYSKQELKNKAQQVERYILEDNMVMMPITLVQYQSMIMFNCIKKGLARPQRIADKLYEQVEPHVENTLNEIRNDPQKREEAINLLGRFGS